ncbi:MAG: hypothetical protein NTY48_05290 [Candidatus Diapherotrites archaeon]|nr:hypothetical protein [Candidatus Diapherotrites archaeon]
MFIDETILTNFELLTKPELLTNPETLVLGMVIIFLVLLLLFFIKYFRGDWINLIQIPSRIPPQGFKFAVLGVSSILSHNTLFPKITFYDDHFEYRILLKQKIFYSQIKKLTAKKYLIMPKDIIVYFNNNSRLWITPGKEENVLELLRFFKNKNNLIQV